MDLDDRITITMPEGGELQLQLAGLGSRLIAGAIDVIIQLVVVVVLLLISGVTVNSTRLNLVVAVIGVFMIWFGYWIMFELLARGRTPGKRLTHLRVVREEGDAVDLPASLIRNLVRVVEGLTLLYVPASLAILATARNQRLGDLAAGTVVIREPTPAQRGRRARKEASSQAWAVAAVDGGGTTLDAAGWDVSAVTPEEVATVRRFLERRGKLEKRAREALALKLVDGLSGRVAGAPAGVDPEDWLEAVVRQKSGLG